MDDLIILRRNRCSTGKFKSLEKRLLKIEFKHGRFIISQKLAETINAEDNTAVMFAFSKKTRCAYIFKEDPQEDSYYIRYAGIARPYYRFTSKDLSQYFIQVFELREEDEVMYFEASETPNEKNYYKLTLY